jgi:hypothetical protein
MAIRSSYQTLFSDLSVIIVWEMAVEILCWFFAKEDTPETHLA